MRGCCGHALQVSRIVAGVAVRVYWLLVLQPWWLSLCASFCAISSDDTLRSLWIFLHSQCFDCDRSARCTFFGALGTFLGAL